MRKKDEAVRRTKTEQVTEYLTKIEGLPTERIAYVDETGIDTCLHREYGWAMRGEELIGRVSGRNFKRVGLVAAKWF